MPDDAAERPRTASDRERARGSPRSSPLAEHDPRAGLHPPYLREREPGGNERRRQHRSAFRRQRDEEPTRRLRVVRERLAGRVGSTRRAVLRTHGFGGRRLSPRRARPARAPRVAPERARIEDRADSAPGRELVRVAGKAEPVTSVTAEGNDQSVGRGEIQLEHRRHCRVERPGGKAALADGLEDDPRPERFARKSASPGPPPLWARSPRDARSRRPRARTSARSRGSCGPGEDRPAARTRSSAPASTSPSISTGRSSGNAAIESASSGEPPMANTLFSAFVAAIAPKVRGSSTSGGRSRP